MDVTHDGVGLSSVSPASTLHKPHSQNVIDTGVDCSIQSKSMGAKLKLVATKEAHKVQDHSPVFDPEANEISDHPLI
jgi:hypothetical protein